GRRVQGGGWGCVGTWRDPESRRLSVGATVRFLRRQPGELIEREARRLAKAVEQRFRRPEIGGAEALGEAPVDRRQELTRRLGPAPSMPQSGEARSRPPLPGQNPLPPRPSHPPPQEHLCPPA